MSGHLRFGFPVFVLLVGLSTSPAYSNSFADFFNFNAAPAQDTAPAAAEEECLQRPGKSTAGLRWVYRLDGRRKCWFQAAEEIAVKKVRHRAAKPSVAAPAETESTQRKRKAVVDARAELLRSAPAEASLPIRTAPEFKVVDAAPVPATGVAAFVPPAPIEKLEIDRLTPDHRPRRQVDVETLLAATPATRDAAASMSAVPVADLTAEEVDDGRSWMTTWLGVLLMALGLVSVLGSSRTVREALVLRG